MQVIKMKRCNKCRFKEECDSYRVVGNLSPADKKLILSVLDKNCNEFEEA